VTLADGSHVELNSQSAIAIHYDAGQRRVRLLEGEAWFEVSPDPVRPFVVEASGGTVTALGTAFNVDAEKERAHVTVTSRGSRKRRRKCHRRRGREDFFQQPAGVSEIKSGCFTEATDCGSIRAFGLLLHFVSL
jgi:FecR protein